MNIKEFGVIVETIRSAFNKKEFLAVVGEKKLWFEMLKDMDYQTVSGNLHRHIMSNKFAPTVAELRGVVDTKDFNNFQRRRYNMDALESELLQVEIEKAKRLELIANQIIGGLQDGNQE